MDLKISVSPAARVQACLNLHQQAQQRGQRLLVLLTGEQTFIEEVMEAFLAQAFPELPAHHQVWLLGERSWLGLEPVTAKQSKNKLGSESDCLLVDGWSGIDPDAWAALSGTLRGGGLCFVLAPEAENWLALRTGFDKKHCVFPAEPQNLQQYFLQRLLRFLVEDKRVALLSAQQLRLPKLITQQHADTVNETLAVADGLGYLGDQKTVVESIQHWANAKHKHRPLLLSADRGRGKSAALGIAAAQLLAADNTISHIVVTAPNRQAVQSIFAMATAWYRAHALQSSQDEVAESDSKHGNHLLLAGGRLSFIAPDELLLNPVAADMLLVDEAAAIPLPLLSQYQNRYRLCLFSTTVHGYEGSGKGFLLRFAAQLDASGKQWQHLQMQQPLRWADNDPLEKFLFELLLFAEELPVLPSLFASSLPQKAELDDIVVEEIEQNLLLLDEALLREIFALLVNAHYRTRPMDLYWLLDGQNMRIFVQRWQGHVVGVCLLAEEGAFSDTLAQAVWESRQRPSGHLLPQQLALNGHYQPALSLRAGRIVRIAVHPSLQQQGLGTRLLQQLQSNLAQHYDYLGASFGVTETVLQFWQKNTFYPVYLGTRREASTAAYAATVLWPCSRAADDMLLALRKKLFSTLLWRSPLYYAQLEPELLMYLLQGVLAEPRLYDSERQDTESHEHGNVALLGENAPPAQLEPILRAFVAQQRSIEMVEPQLRAYVLQQLTQPVWQKLVVLQQILLVARFIQQRSWADMAGHYALAGKTAVQQQIRAALATLLAG